MSNKDATKENKYTVEMPNGYFVTITPQSRKITDVSVSTVKATKLYAFWFDASDVCGNKHKLKTPADIRIFMRSLETRPQVAGYDASQTWYKDTNITQGTGSIVSYREFLDQQKPQKPGKKIKPKAATPSAS